MILLSSLFLVVFISFIQYIYFILFQSNQISSSINPIYFERDVIDMTISFLIIALINLPIIYLMLKNKNKFLIFPKIDPPTSKSIFQIYLIATLISFSIYLFSFFHVYSAAKLIPYGLKYFAKFSIAKYYGFFYQFSVFLAPLIIISSSYLQKIIKYRSNTFLLNLTSLVTVTISIYSSWVFTMKFPFINNIIALLVSFITFNDFSKLDKKKLFQIFSIIIPSFIILTYLQLFLKLGKDSSFSEAIFSVIHRVSGPQILSFVLQECNFINIFTTSCSGFNSNEFSKQIFNAADSTGVAPSFIGYFYMKFSLMGFLILIIYFLIYFIIINIFRIKSNNSTNLPFFLGITNLQLLYLVPTLDGYMGKFLVADGSIIILSIFLFLSSKFIPIRKSKPFIPDQNI